MKKKTSALILAAITAGLVFSAVRSVASEESGISGKTRLVQRVPGGEIDWGSNYYFATGEGLEPSESDEANRAKAYLKARGYARMKAIANLLMAVEGTTISYQSAGRDLTADETIRQTIEGYVRNVEVVGERKREEAGRWGISALPLE